MPGERALKRLLLARVRPEPQYWAVEAEKAIRGAGADTTLLTRLVTLNTPHQLQAVEAAYSKVHAGRVMLDDIAKDVKGWFGKFVVSRLKK